MPPTIRPVRLTDLPRILMIERESFADEAFDAATFVSLYLQGSDTFLVSLDEGRRLTGYITAYRDGAAGYIASIAVAKGARGQGIGRKLMLAVTERLIAKGISVMALHVRLDNTAAIALYQSLGYVARERIKAYYPDGADGLYMEQRVHLPDL